MLWLIDWLIDDQNDDDDDYNFSSGPFTYTMDKNNGAL